VTADPGDPRPAEEVAAERAPSTTQRALLLLAGMRDQTRPVNLADMALRLVLVDDNSGFLQSARLLLEREGITVVALASTGADAVRHTEKLRPDVVLVDVDLGGENGFDVVRGLHERLGPATPGLILISIHSEQDLAELVAASPAVGFISKSQLSAGAIRSLLDSRS
jgi:DNA-binding NarL/FixJ family response regulator